MKKLLVGLLVLGLVPGVLYSADSTTGKSARMSIN